jgi:galactose-1-phosphate uridylyltransferase
MELERYFMTAEMLAPGGGELVRTPIEVRVDPLTGHTTRILPERGLMPPNDFDLAAFARESEPNCPFCPGRITELTPRLPAAIDAFGHITRGEAILFPNLHAYGSHSSVSVYSPRLHYLPLSAISEQLLGDNLATQVQFARAVMAADPDARWASVNANHMLPAGSSLFHPHLQGIVDDRRPSSGCSQRSRRSASRPTSRPSAKPASATSPTPGGSNGSSASRRSRRLS